MRGRGQSIRAMCLAIAIMAACTVISWPSASAASISASSIDETDGIVLAGAASLTVSAGASAATGSVSAADITSAVASIQTAIIEEEAAEEEAEEETEEETAAETEEAEEAQETEEEAEEEEDSPYADIAVSQVGSNSYVNVRTEPNTSSEIVGKIYNNCAATIEEEVEGEDGTWYKITSGNVEGYIKAEYFVTGDEAEELAYEIGKVYAYVLEGGLRLREEASTDAEVITKLWSGEIYTVVDQSIEGWVEITIGDDEDGNAVTGYVAAEYVEVYVKFDKAVTLEEEEEAAASSASYAAAASSASSTRSAIVAYAKQFLGNPYVYGGTSLTNGCDCSGFTKSIMAAFGISIARTSSGQASCGTRVSLSSVQPGDLIFYASGGSIYHVAIYIGNGQVIHAIDESRGIGISSMYFTTPYCAVSVVD